MTLPQTQSQTLPRTLPQVVRRAAARWPQQPAIIDGERRWTFAELGSAVTQVARGFIAHGLQAGDRVAIWAPNQAEWILAASGAQAAGGVVVPINTRMKGAEAADILARSGARFLVSVGRFLDQDFPAMLDGLRPAGLQALVVLPGSPAGADMPWQALLDAGAAVPEAAVAAREAALDGDSLADLMFTSGTTGRPKGVMASHGAAIRAFDAWAQVVGLNEGDRYLIVNPFFHSFGYKAGWLAALLRGATIVPHPVFDAESVLRCIQDQRISFLPGPPTLYLTMLAHPRLQAFDLSSLKGAVTGAASVPPVLIRRMREELGIERVTTAYGLTECGGCATVCDPSDDVDTIAGTCGKALPGTEVVCADDQGHPLPPGQPGEVLLRGYHVMQGYFEDPAATAQAIGPDGWLHTGDVGVLDERGYLRITDRLKDMFIVGGFNCYPAEIEGMLAEHPAIAQVAVVGVPDERLGEVGCACVVLRPGAQLAEDELVAWARERMANYKVPRRLQLLPALPLNASGKVQKRELAAALRSPSSKQGM